jgi:RNA recognition motif-containing protein
VRKNNVARHLGYGFVTYALLDDAKRAVETMDGKQVGGRAVSVSFAKQRGTLEERRKRAGETASPSATPSVAAALPTDTDEATPSEKVPKSAAPKQPTQPRPKLGKLSAEEKHRFVRTVALSGFSDETKAAALKLAKGKAKGKVRAHLLFSLSSGNLCSLGRLKRGYFEIEVFLLRVLRTAFLPVWC